MHVSGSSLVVVRDAVGPVVLVHNEGGAFQGTGADHTREALRMVGFARGPQHSVSDWLPTGVALLQGILKRQQEQVARGQVRGSSTPCPAQDPQARLTV